jgi:lysophospholipase L1-like esterase
MIIACLGDSLTEGDYGIYSKRGIGNVKEKGYPYFLSKSTGATVKNYGKCGFTATSFLKYYNSGAVDVKDADIILIMLGSNGGLDPENDVQGNRDYAELIKNCISDAPKAEILLITPPHVSSDPHMSNCGYQPNIDNAIPVIKRLKEEFSLKLIDLNGYDEFCAENEYLYQANDGLHFTEIGYRVMANFIEDDLKKKGILK